jgi:hypothetical protein
MFMQCVNTWQFFALVIRRILISEFVSLGCVAVILYVYTYIPVTGRTVRRRGSHII